MASIPDKIEAALRPIATVLIIMAPFATLGIWATGGFKPQQQVAVEQLSTKVDGLTDAVGKMRDGLALMPRPSDYAAQERHIGQIEAHVERLSEQIGHDKIEGSVRDTANEAGLQAVKDRVTRLEAGVNTPVRNPH